jgi:tRNA(fMet)-specific endonuclease VapC
MTYLLDTDTFSNLARNHARVELRYMLVGPSTTCISAVTLHEIEFGRRLNPERMRQLNPRIDALLSEIPVLPFDFDDARTSGRIDATLNRAGEKIGWYDVLIAGAALARELILVTSNTREFCRVDGLQLEDWREATMEVRDSHIPYGARSRPPIRATSVPHPRAA